MCKVLKAEKVVRRVLKRITDFSTSELPTAGQDHHIVAVTSRRDQCPWMCSGGGACATAEDPEEFAVADVHSEPHCRQEQHFGDIVAQRQGLAAQMHDDQQHPVQGLNRLPSQDTVDPASALCAEPDMDTQHTGDPRVTDLGHFRLPVQYDALPAGTFTRVRKVATGLQGDVFEYKWLEGNIFLRVAVKKLRSHDFESIRAGETNDMSLHLTPWCYADQVEDAQTEIGVLTYLSKQADVPEFILKMLGVFGEGRHVWLVTEFAEGGELFHVAANEVVSEAQSTQYAGQFLQALAYLHRHRIGHRDISLENMLLKDGVVKVMDFGMAVLSHAADGVPLRYFRAAGKDFYRAPECYIPPQQTARVVMPENARPGDVALVKVGSEYLCEVRFPSDALPTHVCESELWGYAVQPVDVFASGICLFMLLFQCPPWGEARLRDRFFEFVHRTPSGIKALLAHFKKELPSEGTMRLLAGMLAVDPAQRVSAERCLDSVCVTITCD